MTWAGVADLVEALLPGGMIAVELDGAAGVVVFRVEVSDDGEEITIGIDERRATKAMSAADFATVLRRSAAAVAVQ